MTGNEAVNTLQYLLGYENAVDSGELDKPNQLNSQEKEALQTILEEIQQYRAIGTIDQCSKAMDIIKAMIERGIEPEHMEAYIKFENDMVSKGYTVKGLLEAGKKMKPKKPSKMLGDYVGTCECGNTVFDCIKYCSNCGQAILWEE